MQRFDWKPFAVPDKRALKETVSQVHSAIQNVAAVGRRFLPESKHDQNSVLYWIPGLTRLAGKWVEGDFIFRSSLSFTDFAIYLVDEKMNTHATFRLDGKTHLQGMLWLEEQIGKFGLNAANLAMNLPYELPRYPPLSGAPFHQPPVVMLEELGKYFHNAFIVLRDFKVQYREEAKVHIWPHHFDEALKILVKDTGDSETNFSVALGMMPWDSHFKQPYFYINTWPFIDTSRCPPLSHGAIWVEDQWTGAALLADQVCGARDQEAVIRQFYTEATDVLIELLKK